MNIQAEHPEELLEILRGIDMDVPLRTEGRKTEHTERYSICYLLSSLTNAGLLNFPISLSHEDRPDFVLSVPGTTIGIEHTEAVPQNEAAKDALRENGIGSEIHFLSRAIPGEKRRKSKQLRTEIIADNPGDGWAGEQVEREWAEAMEFFLQEKVRKLNADGFKRHKENWLLIYDNWPLPNVDRAKALSYLQNILERQEVEFEHIYVLSGEYLCEISGDNTDLYAINNIWK